MQNILVFGATSAIAEQTIRLYAQQGANLYLVARNQEKLTLIGQDAEIRGAKQVSTQILDLNEFSEHEACVNQAFDTLGQVDVVLIAHGSLPNQTECELDVEKTLQEFNTNGLSAVSLLTLLANKLQTQKSGSLAVITSVAGDRGRQSNYVYGAAKGMLSRYLQGLRNRLHADGVHVLDIKPGFVDTPMTAEFPKGPLWAKPEQIANSIIKAVNKKKDTLYTPFFWWGIMLIIRNIPEFIFKKLSL